MKIKLFLLTTFSWGVLSPQGQKRASQLRKPLTMWPQIGKDCSKQGQTHLLQKLTTRFLPAFSLLKNFFLTSHSASYSSLCCLPFWCHCNSLEVHVLCMAVGVKTIQSAGLNAILGLIPTLFSCWSPTIYSCLMVMDRGSQQCFGIMPGHRSFLRRRDGRKPQDTSPDPKMCSLIADHAAHACSWYTT